MSKALAREFLGALQFVAWNRRGIWATELLSATVKAFFGKEGTRIRAGSLQGDSGVTPFLYR